VWEHAYYIDCRNERPRYVKAFWQIVDWEFRRTQLRRWLSERPRAADGPRGYAPGARARFPLRPIAVAAVAFASMR
jgi:hypothetical protein